MAGVAGTAVSQTVDVGWGALAGLVMGLSQAIFGPLLGTIGGAIGAGMIHKKQRDTIALLAGWSLVQGSIGGASATTAASTTNGTNGGVM